MWIPYVNFINIFAWLGSTRQMTQFQRKWTTILGFSSVVLCALLQFGVSFFVPQVEVYSGQVLLYLIPLALSRGFIYLQECPQPKSGEQQSNKSKKWLGLIVGGCLLVIILVAVVLFRSGTQQIADQNGVENTSLAILTREDIISEKMCTILNHSVTATGRKSTAESEYRDVDYTTVSHKYGKLSGVQTAHATKTSAQSITLTITTTLNSGNMEVVVVIEGEYYQSVPLNQTTKITLDNVSDKTVLVRVAGESAQGEVSVTRS